MADRQDTDGIIRCLLDAISDGEMDDSSDRADGRVAFRCGVDAPCEARHKGGCGFAAASGGAGR